MAELAFYEWILFSLFAKGQEKQEAILINKSLNHRLLLSEYNLKLSDLKTQEEIVISWLVNPDSGYSALLESTQKLLKDNKLKGAAVPLTILNKYNLEKHGKSAENPITSAKEIDQEKLKAAFVAAWNEKNSGNPATTFVQILDNNPQPANSQNKSSQETQIKQNSHDTVLKALNLKLSDLPAQENLVVSWLNDPNSGYPALLESVQKLIKNKKLKGKAVPLTILNDYNLREHGKTADTPITSTKEINPDKLKAALLKAWNIKNSGTPAKTFGDIVE